MRRDPDGRKKDPIIMSPRFAPMARQMSALAVLFALSGIDAASSRAAIAN